MALTELKMKFAEHYVQGATAGQGGASVQEAGYNVANPASARSIASEVRLKFRWAIVIEADCWEWRGILNYEGLPIVHQAYETYQARRISWRLYRGLLPHGLRLGLKCEHRRCTRPEHLRVLDRPDHPSAWLPLKPKTERGWAGGFPRDAQGKYLPAFVAEFWGLVAQDGAAGCWPWRGKINTNGVPLLCAWGQVCTARRVAYQITFGDLPARLRVYPACGSRVCMNPAHMLTGHLGKGNRSGGMA